DLHEPLPRDSLHVRLAGFLYEGAWYARITVHNHSLRPVELDASLSFSADYADIFEIRGVKRPRRGALGTPALERACVVLCYDGLDGVRRSTRLAFSPEP